MSNSNFQSPEKLEVLNLLHRVLSPPDEAIPSGIPEETISEFEERLEIKVPSKFREWLTTCNGPCVGPGGLMGIRTLRRDLDIETIYSMYPVWKDNGWIPVAGDGCGNYYLVVCKGDYGDGEPVIFIDSMEDSSTPFYIAASDTWIFLSFLLKKELGESNWPYSQEEVEGADPKILSFHCINLPWNA